MSQEFYSPYQFLPVTGRVRGDDDKDRDVSIIDYERIRSGEDETVAVRHDRWQPGRCSGRIICRLTTKTPLIVGSKQEVAKGIPGKFIAPYRRNNRPAIPGSSLRGMIGSLAEALSQSALRVLDQDDYSVRTGKSSLEAIGLLRQDSGSWWLLPLALTTLHLDLREGGINRKRQGKWLKIFEQEGPCPLNQCVARYFHNYWTEKDPETKKPKEIFPLDGISCYHAVTNDQMWYADRQLALDDLHLSDAFSIGDWLDHLKQGRDDAPIAWRRIIRGCPRGHPRSANDMPGVLYVLGYHSHEEMPNKRHEWFLPFGDCLKTRKWLPVNEDAIAELEYLAAERAGSKTRHPLPFTPVGYGPRTSLRHGDLVYFDIDFDDQAPKVIRLSWSAMWRRRVPGDLYTSFRKAAGVNALPWGRQRTEGQKRSGLTPAECLFGVVEETDEVARNNLPGHGQATRNLASRLSFGDALPLETSDELLLPEVDLRAPGAPKPPSPAMYFRSPQGEDPSTQQNLSLAKHIPQGRKVYLHYRCDQVEAAPPPWETGRLDKADECAREGKNTQANELRDAYYDQGGAKGRPIAPNKSFYFHIDFDNLTRAELDLLCTALVPEDNATSLQTSEKRFLHKLGWGKPLGLGSVEVSILRIFTIDRISRYTPADILGTDQPAMICCAISAEWPDELAELYPLEYGIEPTSDSNLSGTKPDTSLVDRRTLAALLAIGDRSRIKHPVSYPFTTDQGPGNEQEGFKWFTANTQAKGDAYQYLEPVDGEGNLPPLYAHKPKR